jgi:hypothetical protein
MTFAYDQAIATFEATLAKGVHPVFAQDAALTEFLRWSRYVHEVTVS